MEVTYVDDLSRVAIDKAILRFRFSFYEPEFRRNPNSYRFLLRASGIYLRHECYQRSDKPNLSTRRVKIETCGQVQEVETWKMCQSMTWGSARLFLSRFTRSNFHLQHMICVWSLPQWMWRSTTARNCCGVKTTETWKWNFVSFFSTLEHWSEIGKYRSTHRTLVEWH